MAFLRATVKNVNPKRDELAEEALKAARWKPGGSGNTDRDLGGQLGEAF
jgi:hypothetical protein